MGGLWELSAIEGHLARLVTPTVNLQCYTVPLPSSLSSCTARARPRVVQVVGGFETLSASSTIMMPKPKFEARFEEYRPWLHARMHAAAAAEEVEEAVEAAVEATVGVGVSIAELETRHGKLLEAEMLSSCDDVPDA